MKRVNSPAAKKMTASTKNENWDSYIELVSKAKNNLDTSSAVIVIDESLRRRLGKSKISSLVEKLVTCAHCYVEIIPTGTADQDVIKITNHYADFPTLLLTSDKELYSKLPDKALYVYHKRHDEVKQVYSQIIRRLLKM
jgi:hypothetical protein